LETLLALEMVRVTEAAAIASARFMGRGDHMGADRAATEAMRATMDDVEMCGTIVIGEGERDEAPMLWIGEPVGIRREEMPDVDIAVDPLEGTNLVAHGQANAITVLAAADKGGLVHAPDTYLEKLCVGPVVAGHVDIRATPTENVRAIAAALGRRVSDITVVILERPRHDALIEEVRTAGARIKLISDGDLSAAISCAVSGTGVHAVMGIGGAPEGVITAAALRCLGGEIQARFRFRNDEERERAARMGHTDEDRVYTTTDLAPGETLVFSATGVTEGDLLQGVRFFGGGARTHSLVMAYQTKQVRFVDTVHMFDRDRRRASVSSGRSTGALPGPTRRPRRTASSPFDRRPSTAHRLDRLVPAGRHQPRRDIGERRDDEQSARAPRRVARRATARRSWRGRGCASRRSARRGSGVGRRSAGPDRARGDPIDRDPGVPTPARCPSAPRAARVRRLPAPDRLARRAPRRR
jgi:fructose-1,6-bisphosphatase II